MSILKSLLIKLGLADLTVNRNPIYVMVLDDDERRHRWFMKRFAGDFVEIAANVEEAKALLEERPFDAIFLDHDLLPHHYESNSHDDFANTGYAIAEYLHDRDEIQRAATIIVHTRNADAAIRMVEKIRDSGRSVEYCAFPMLDLKIKNYWKH
jgi:CheY-like chemotaxis protein